MEKKLLFSNRYEKDMDLFDDLPDDMPELSDIDDTKIPTIDDFYEYMNRKRRCVPNEEKRSIFVDWNYSLHLFRIAQAFDTLFLINFLNYFFERDFRTID